MRLAPLAAVVVACAVACGRSGSSPTTVVLGPASPRLADVYIAISGATAAVDFEANLIERARYGRRGSNFVSAPAARGHVVCTFTRQFARGELAGQTVTFAVHGGVNFAPSICHGVADGLLFGETKEIRVPSSSMQPTLPGRVLVEPTSAVGLARGDILVFETDKTAVMDCGTGPLSVDRVIGLPGETVREDGNGFISIRSPRSKLWVKLREPYVSARARKLDSSHRNRQWAVPQGRVFVLGDNRSASCDSRRWGSLSTGDIVGVVTAVRRAAGGISQRKIALR